MEFDLNHALSEIDKNTCIENGGKCDIGGFGGCLQRCLPTSTSSCSSNAASGSTFPSSESPKSSLYAELWHACAGPLTNLPDKGSVVVYFAQGHMEQAASALPFPPLELPTFDLPPQIFCRVADVQLLANKENDEVYTQLTLLPLQELVGLKLEGKEKENAGVEEDENGALPLKLTSHMFCKTLTASDTSTHGGFSVPRRAAEDCFPPLDYKEQRPSQELKAKDLQGVEWKFKHIYRGQPRRHLLTTGWSIFVSQKNLVSGDAILFLRGEDGDLRLGIRRAARPRNGLPDSIIKNQNSYPNVLSSVANALSSNITFHVFYTPRASHADFVIPHEKYVKCTRGQIPIGMRFEMKFDLDDSPERRFSGVVTGISDMDPYRWPNSKWRSLMVCWDDDIVSNHQERVSPWDIEFPGGGARFDFGESIRSSKVLQGQENVTLASAVYKSDRINHQLDFETHPAATNLISNKMKKINYTEFGRNRAPSSLSGFLQSSWSPEVLQGQEIYSLRSLAGKNDTNLGAWSKPELGGNIFDAHQNPRPYFYPLASEGSRRMLFPQKGVYRARQGPLMLSNFSNIQTGDLSLDPTSILSGTSKDIGNVPLLSNEQRPADVISAPPTTIMHLKKVNDENKLKDKDPECKLFGFSLTDDHVSSNSQGPSKRSCTKVHKQGSLVGRAIDLSRLQGYDNMLTELERLFSMEGLLRDPDNGWRILYTDSENDMMVVGDDPWHEFIEVVSKIHIHTREEVEKLSFGINSDDTQSCLEEAPPPMADASGGRLDSSVTLVGM
ncbi:auxin response factor 4-like isoform X2 [Primulina huaijiensis]|uniref:auxin response factor 4-like isoform X2 n=1 Tax=Primulina huaijiensis TaxID=1492673 RepID=UPI003CC6E004